MITELTDKESTFLTEEEEFKAVVQNCCQNVYRWVVSRVRDTHDAEDILMKVLANAWGFHGSFPDGDTLEHWIWRQAWSISGNLLFKRQREHGREEYIGDKRWHNIASPDESPSTLLEQKERACCLREAIETLPLQEMTAAECCLMDLSGCEGAKRCKCEEDAYRQRLSRARKHLKEILIQTLR